MTMLPKWGLDINGSSNESGSGAGLIQVSPEGDWMHCALRFSFKASNNEVEYEVLIARQVSPRNECRVLRDLQ